MDLVTPVALDVTDRKEAEDELRRAHDELEHRVAERTEELAEANARQKEDIAKRHKVEESLRAERRLLKRLLDLNARDRQLIAYEIHDGIVQDMTGALMFLEAASYEMSEESERARENVLGCIKLLRESLDEARRLIDGLRPPVLDEAGLVAAVENLVAEIAINANIAVELDVQVTFDRIAPTLEMAAYRIVQEGLNNVRQHSGSKKARVRLKQKDGRIEVSIRDWGAGFDPASVGKKRYGLVGVRERARLLGGTADIESVIGKGTRVTVELPLTDVLLPDEPPPPKRPGDEDSDDDPSSSWRI